MKEKYAQEKEKYAQEKETEKEKEKKESFMAKKEEIKNVIVTKQPLYLLFRKEVVLFTSTPNTQKFPSCVEFLLQEFEALFPKEISDGLPPLRGIEQPSGLSFLNNSHM